MASDIILKDNKESSFYSVEILGDLTTFRHPSGESSLTVNTNPRMCKVFIGDSENTTNSYLKISDKMGTTTLSSKSINTDFIRAETLRAKEISVSKLTIASPIAEELTSGKMEVLGSDGEPAVTLDGEKGDIIMREIGGSLIDKLKEMAGSTQSVGSEGHQNSASKSDIKLPIYIYESGTSNPERTIISHSPKYKKWGMSYKDRGDKLIIKAAGSPVLTADLGQKRVGIGTEDPSHSLHVEGEVAGRGGYKSLSDVRCKQNVKDVTNGLEIIKALRSVSFNWNDNDLTGQNPPEEHDYGFIAQEVEKILPELVTKDSLGRLSLTYSSLIPFLVDSIQSQQKIIQKQENEVDRLSVKYESLEKRINQLESK